MNKIKAIVKLAIVVSVLMTSFLYGCRHLNNGPEDPADVTSDYDKIQEINDDAEFEKIISAYSAGQADGSELNKKLDLFKEQKVIKDYYWSSDEHTIICILPGGTKHLISFIIEPGL